MLMSPDIHEWVRGEEAKFETDEIKVGDNWFWNFRNHVQLIFHLKNGVFFTGENNWLRAFKNVTEPILELSYWTEDLEVKDVTFFIENQVGKVLSFLVKKYYDEVYTREHDLDSLFDEITESDLDYGGVLNQKGLKRPETIPLQSVAFCDQTDILGGTIGFRFSFSPSKLREMSKFGWGEEKNGATISIEDLCMLATFEKETNLMGDKKNQVSGKTIDVKIVRGNLPEHYLKDNNDMEYYCNQIQVIADYVDKDGEKQGVVLYRKKAEDSDLKFFTSKKVYQRALGRGVGERLLHPQIWTNFLTIHKMNKLEAGAKSALVTDDSTWTQKNKIQDMENLEVTTIEDGKTVKLIPTINPTDITLYDNDINLWYQQAQNDGAAQDPIMGAEAASGTTFRGQERSVAQGRGTHDKRRGQRAKYIEEIHRDWIIPDIKKEILKGKKFIATLSTEELTWVAEQLSIKSANDKVKSLLLKGKMVTKEEQTLMIQTFKDGVLKKGNKQLLEILKDEFEDVEIKIGINVANKQKNLTDLSDKLLSIFQFIFANPTGFQQAMQIPALAKSFENILEYGGMSIADFSTLLTAPAQPIVSPLQPQGEAPQLAPSTATQ
jgi:hypothetical protein